MFNILSHYCSSGPCLITNKRADKIHYGLQFFTRSLPYFTELHPYFIPTARAAAHEVGAVLNSSSEYYDLLTPVALAHMIRGGGDGQSSRHGLIYVLILIQFKM